MSRGRVRREWSIQDYLDQLDFWREVPPPNISLALIARAHGAKFEDKPRLTPTGDQEAELAQLLASIPQRPITR